MLARSMLARSLLAQPIPSPTPPPGGPHPDQPRRLTGTFEPGPDHINVDQYDHKTATLKFRRLAMISHAVELAASIGSGLRLLLTRCRWNPHPAKMGIPGERP